MVFDQSFSVAARGADKAAAAKYLDYVLSPEVQLFMAKEWLIAPTNAAQSRKHLATAESSPGKSNSARSRSKSDDNGFATATLETGISPAAMPSAIASNRAPTTRVPGPTVRSAGA